MEPIFASDEIHINDHVNDVASVSHTMNLSSWGTVLVANASKARKLVRRDDLAAAKVVGIWLGCFFIIFLVVGIPNYIQKKRREAQENSDRISQALGQRLSMDEVPGLE
ncbi:unnamed protein product [Ixodes pacificus]|uniref:Uncharacterized protein n=1 Tax=Ixodes scapularis TaxID=6945 RepID=B7PWB7_IXOSC|nr:hypothetical protein IscW_ISCW006966 [Ixodes scapularis]|eukprot:XP_002409659.1 hypothetical protein IscW_ISCW006966 [Ixodes scapularis]